MSRINKNNMIALTPCYNCLDHWMILMSNSIAPALPASGSSSVIAVSWSVRLSYYSNSIPLIHFVAAHLTFKYFCFP